MREKQQNILLIEPPYYRLFKETYSLHRYPLSLGYLAAAIRENTEWGVMVYNADFYMQDEPIEVTYLANEGFDNYKDNLKDPSYCVWNEIRSVIEEYKPAVVGITSKSQNFASSCLVAKIAKEVNRQIIVIVGGPHPSIVGPNTLSCPDIDIAVKGEGENTIAELLCAIESEKDVDNVQGIVYRKDWRVIENVGRDFIKVLDSLPFPHQTAPEALRDHEQYPRTAFRSVLATRGCPYNCSFCGSNKIWSRRARFRSPENVIAEIGYLQNLGLRSVHFDDDTFGINRKYISDLCNAFMTHCPQLKWSCELHVKLVDEQTISLLKAAGCYLIQIGIESGNNEILKQIRKNITIQEALAACEIIKKHGIELHAFFMVGFPQETEDTLNDTVVAMKAIKCDMLIYSIFTPYPGTESFEYCKERGLISDDHDVSLYNHQSPLNCFCENISPERFRILVSEIEEFVDRFNARNRMRRIFTLNTCRKMRELGILGSIKKGIRLFIDK